MGALCLSILALKTMLPTDISNRAFKDGTPIFIAALFLVIYAFSLVIWSARQFSAIIDRINKKMQDATRKEIEDIKESQEYMALIEYGKPLFLWMLFSMLMLFSLGVTCIAL